MKSSLFILLSGFLVCSISAFKCIRACEEEIVIPMKISQLSTVHLDNRGQQPLELGPGAEGFLQAYGFRLFVQNALVNPADSLQLDDVCAAPVSSEVISTCKIFRIGSTPDGMQTKHDVSAWFRYVDRTGSVPAYRSVQEMLNYLQEEPTTLQDKAIDFVMVTPPTFKGIFVFELQLTTEDSTVYATTTAPIYLQ